MRRRATRATSRLFVVLVVLFVRASSGPKFSYVVYRMARAANRRLFTLVGPLS